MAFDNSTRNRLSGLVGRVRDLLTREFDAQLQELYGIYAGEGRVLDLSKLPHLDDEKLRVAHLLRERIRHLAAGAGGTPDAITQAVRRVLREQAFTVLNRFAALRMAEERGLIVEAVGGGLNSKGFKTFSEVAFSGLGAAYERYRVFLLAMFDEMAVDLGVLFDRRSPYGLLLPRENVLLEVFQLLNAPEVKPLWKEDETIGWIYQYFNDPTERKKMRDESAAPRNSRELAVRNQFFTPRYVVEFLTDNTLGRIWYEMTRGETTLKEQCRYLVRRPNETFLNPRFLNLFADIRPWVAEIAAGKFTAAVADASWNEISTVALLLDCYQWIEKTGHQELFNWAEPHLKAAIETEQVPALSHHELWLLLFACQRAYLKEGLRDDDTKTADGIRRIWNAWCAAAKEPQQKQDNLSQEDLLKQPVFIPHRPLKDPRTILMLDPACGSMHFGLYAFDLFEVIYAEAWGLEEVGQLVPSRPPGLKSLHETYADKQAFLRDVPKLIIEHNIHGIDIDPRAAQIAGLALWLRAQRAWKDMGLAPAQRPAIKRSNIVCAEPMPGEKELLREFVEREFPAAERAVCLRLLEAIFDKMQLAGEAGSLLKIEEEIRSAIEDARDAWQKLATKPPELFTNTELNQLSTAPELTGLEQAVSSLTTDPRHLTTDFWERIEERIYAALRDYAEQAENGGGFQRRLFAEDAARGFAFIDVCRKRYDVALMNPPFGRGTVEVEGWCKAKYENAYIDIYACFVTRCSAMLLETGCLGAITARSFFNAVTLERFRMDILPRLQVLIELGGQVLDSALVDTALTILGPASLIGKCLCLDLTQSQDKHLDLQRLTGGDVSDANVYLVARKRFAEMPNGQLLYSLAGENLKTELMFEPAACGVRAGLNTFDDFRFLRLWWEVLPRDIGPTCKWSNHWKGGDYETFYSELCVVCKWSGDGREMRQVNFQQHGMEAQAKQSSAFYFRSGAAYTYRSSRGFSVRVFPEGCTFAVNGPVIQPCGVVDFYYVLGWVNSELIRALVHAQANANLFTPGIVKSLPWINPTEAIQQKVAGRVRLILRNKMSEYARHETGRYFHAARLVSADTGVKAANADIQSQQDAADVLITQAAAETTDVVREFYAGVVTVDWEKHGIQTDDHKLNAEVRILGSDYSSMLVSKCVGVAFGRWDIRYATGEQAAPELPDPFAPLPVCPPGQLQNAQGLPARPEDVPAAYPVRIPWDGILVDDPNHPLDIERRVREIIEIIWSGQEGGPTAEAIEHEACEILGVKTLRDYFRKPAGFFADHLKRYSKSRRQAPIYWPLSTASGSYTLWIYYHRLTDQTLFQCVNEFMKPKITEVEGDLARVMAEGVEQSGNRAEAERLTTLRTELIEFRDELLRVAGLPYKPNLNDGVLITAAPLWKLFRLPKWQKDLKACWQELEKGDYDWAHLTLTLWPDRVREKCKTDRSLAIAHGLEELCEVKAPEKKAKKGMIAKDASDTEADLELALAAEGGEPAEDRPKKRTAKSDNEPVPIEKTDRTEVLCVIRQVFGSGGARDRDTAIKDIAFALGYRRTGSKIRDVLHIDIMTAVRRGILRDEDSLLSLISNDIRDFERDSLKEDFLSALGRTWTEREDAVRSFARFLGYARTGPVIEDTARSLINGLIRDGRLESDGDRIRRA